MKCRAPRPAFPFCAWPPLAYSLSVKLSDIGKASLEKAGCPTHRVLCDEWVAGGFRAGVSHPSLAKSQTPKIRSSGSPA